MTQRRPVEERPRWDHPGPRPTARCYKGGGTRRSREACTAASPRRSVTKRRRFPAARSLVPRGKSVYPSRAIETTNVSAGKTISCRHLPTRGEAASSRASSNSLSFPRRFVRRTPRQRRLVGGHDVACAQPTDDPLLVDHDRFAHARLGELFQGLVQSLARCQRQHGICPIRQCSGIADLCSYHGIAHTQGGEQGEAETHAVGGSTAPVGQLNAVDRGITDQRRRLGVPRLPKERRGVSTTAFSGTI
jgi:hypothetical protein